MEECELLRDVCRACLTDDGEFQSVFASDERSGASIHISEIMSSCTSIQEITLGDGLPDQICAECVINIVNMYLFKLKCEKSDSFLRANLKNGSLFSKDKVQEDHVEQPDPEEVEKKPAKPELVKGKKPTVPQEAETLLEFVEDLDMYKSNNEEDIPDYLDVKNIKDIVEQPHSEDIDIKPVKLEIVVKEETNEPQDSNQISCLKDHMRIPNEEKPYLCTTCGRGFNVIGNLRQHIIRHSGIKSYLCSTCGNGFASKGELSAHYLRKHTGARPFVCQVCGHGFTTSGSRTKHLRIHSGEKPYECDICKMKFSRSGILVRHKRTHTGVKPYSCKFCAKAFSQSNNLTMHLRIHTGEKPYICDECGQAFRQSSALITHIKTHNVIKRKT